MCYGVLPSATKCRINEPSAPKSFQNPNTKGHVAVERSIRTVEVKTNNNNGSRGFTKSQNMHNSAFRYKLDTSSKNLKALIYKENHIFRINFKGANI